MGQLLARSSAAAGEGCRPLGEDDAGGAGQGPGPVAALAQAHARGADAPAPALRGVPETATGRAAAHPRSLPEIPEAAGGPAAAAAGTLEEPDSRPAAGFEAESRPAQRSRQYHTPAEAIKNPL